MTRRLAGRLPRRRLDGRWEYTSAESAIEEAVFKPMETYIQQRKNTDAQYIATQPILGLCEVTDRKQEGQVGMRWQEQVGLDLAGSRDTD